MNWGNKLIDANRLEEAREKIEKGLELERESAWGHTVLAQLYNTEERFEEAIVEVARASELDPEHEDIYLLWGRILINKQEYEEARNTLLTQGKNEEAAEKYEKAYTLNQNNAELLNSWGVLLYNSTKYEEAVEKYKRALEIDPEGVFYYINYGLVLFHQGDSEGARDMYLKAVNLLQKSQKVEAEQIINTVREELIHAEGQLDEQTDEARCNHNQAKLNGIKEFFKLVNDKQ